MHSGAEDPVVAEERWTLSRSLPCAGAGPGPPPGRARGGAPWRHAAGGRRRDSRSTSRNLLPPTRPRIGIIRPRRFCSAGSATCASSATLRYCIPTHLQPAAGRNDLLSRRPGGDPVRSQAGRHRRRTPPATTRPALRRCLPQEPGELRTGNPVPRGSGEETCAPDGESTCASSASEPGGSSTPQPATFSAIAAGASSGVGRYKLLVSRAGVYRLDYSALQTSAPDLRATTTTWSLSSEGIEVPIAIRSVGGGSGETDGVFDTGDTLEF